MSLHHTNLLGHMKKKEEFSISMKEKELKEIWPILGLWYLVDNFLKIVNIGG